MKKRSHKIILVCVLVVAVLAAAAPFVYDWWKCNIPPATYDNYGIIVVNARDGIALKGTEDFAGVRVHEEEQKTVWYLKEGSRCTMAYLRRLFHGVDFEGVFKYPGTIAYAPYTMPDVYRALLTIEEDYINPGTAYGGYSFRFSGDCFWADDELGWRIILYVDGKDAQFIKDSLTEQYGDMVIFESETYTEEEIRGRWELLICKWYHKESRGYTG